MILQEAILHIPLSQYAFANSERNLTIRIRVAKDNLTDCVLWYGDRVQPGDPIVFTAVYMKKILSDMHFDYYDATFETPYDRVCYYFELKDPEETRFYYADICAKYLPVERSEFYQYPFIRREEICEEPKWFREAIVYNIFPDSFASGHREIVGQGKEMEWQNGIRLKSRLGGTIQGIRENLDYIQNLGFNCIYLNPVFTAGEYHKYDLLDYFHVSPNMGTDEEFRELVQDIHNRGMHIVIDGVFNHCSWYFPQFSDVVEKGESSEYANWFYRLQFPVIRPATEEEKPTYSCFAYERKMPKLNSSNPEERAYFMEVCRYWIREFKVDGWRLDVANEVDRGFWRDFRRAAHEENPESVMIGEIWESSETWLNGDMFDSTMNYDFRKNCRDFFALRKISAEEFHDRIVKMLLRYRTGTLRGQLNLLDSHDVNRFLSYCEGDLRRFRLAEVFLFTSPGIPCVFYGDELGMNGSSETTLRGPMPWEKVQDGEDDFFSRLIAIRKEHEELTYGDYTLRYMDHDGGYIYQRTWGDHKITVCLNNGSTTIDLREYLGKGSVLLSESYEAGKLGSMGYAIIEEK